MKPESKRPITIEDLLRVKRAERPPAEFWNDFDRALRAKQLAALVEKRPWWQSLPRAFAGFRRYQIPLGASAVVALTFFSVRHYSGDTPAPQNPPMTATMVAAQENVTPRAAMTAPAETLARTNISEQTMAAAAKVENAARGTSIAVAPLTSEATEPGELSHIIPSIGTSVASAEPEALSPSARAIAANLATVRGSEPVLARTLLHNPASTSLHATEHVAIEPLQQIASPGERRRSNLLTAMVSMASFEMPTRTTERAASRLSQDELYDRIHRFDARGAGVMMKF